MSVIGFGKTAEGALITAAMLSTRITSATVYYNGQSITFGSGHGFDTQPFDDCVCAINAGTILGPLATLINQIYESATDDPSVSTALSGADFTSMKTTSDSQMRRGTIQCEDTKRYLFLRTEAQGTTITIDFGAVWIGGKPRQQPVEQHLEFDV